MPITVMLCCNDPNNGLFLGKAESIEVGDIELEGPSIAISYKEQKLSRASPMEGEHTLRIGRLQVPALGYKTWVGNWCWDAAKVRGVHALRILNFLAAKPHWHCTQAVCEIYEAFNDRRKITPDEWKRAHS